MKMSSNTLKETKLLAEGRAPGLVTSGKDLLDRFSVRPNASSYIEDIHRRAETVTPLLKKFLDYRPPPHWGINE